MIKSLLGLIKSKNFQGTPILANLAKAIFDADGLPPPYGVYFKASLGEKVYHASNFAFETSIDQNGNILIFSASVRGLMLCLIFGKPDSGQSNLTYRPTSIVFKKGTYEKILELTWLDKVPLSPRRDLVLTLAGRYDGDPPTILPWERTGKFRLSKKGN